ncbi:MAG: transcription-repair coupling factor [Nitrospinae bacterium]|nr:transcription-repair coupling factor [Nitrospinota bacterium]
METISLYALESLAGAGGKTPVTCGGLTKSSKGLVIATLARRLERPLMVVCAKAAAAEELYEIIRFFNPDDSVCPLLHFPPWEVLPYEEMSPHPEVSGQRLSTLSRLINAPRRFILITAVEALARKTLPPDVLKKAVLRIDRGDSIDLELLTGHLASYGYRRTGMVEDRGEFSVRGGIVDVFPGHGDHPARIVLFGDEVDSIRLYNPDNQRSVKEIEKVSLFPFREVFYEGVDMERLTASFREMSARLGVGGHRAAVTEGALASRQFFAGMERLLPCFYGDAATLFDYLPQGAGIVVDEPEMVEAHCETFYGLIEAEREDALGKKEIAPEQDKLFITRDQAREIIAARSLLNIRELAIDEGAGSFHVLSTRAPEHYRANAEAFTGDIKKFIAEGYTTVIAASSNGEAERVERLLKDHDIGARRIEREQTGGLVESLCDPQSGLFEERLYLSTGSLPEGLLIPKDKLAVITGDEIFGKVARIKHRMRPSRNVFAASVADLKPGDNVVHKNHGVGRYVRTVEMTIADVPGEYLELEYAERQKLYVPISSVYLLKKFVSGGDSHPQLDRMGGASWKKTRARVKKAVMEMAGKLLAIHAARELEAGRPFTPDGAFHREFADTFEFEETGDQLSAIADVAADMEKKKQMDRLVCGDVGYGKTEVAMRAAFKAAYDGRQVAVLVPTTLLAQQHHQTFSERFKSFPMQVETLSRFKSKKDQREIVGKIAVGEVDIVIGTHRILQGDVRFKDLGLVIIDEEQRFGVKHKEKLRSLAKGVDMLTLSATPIPRTLHTAMLGIRDLSVIQTPPVDRQSIRTFIAKFSETVIREAVTRELDRGGQVFFVHNKVKSIHSVAKYLARTVPGARIIVAHGQMPEHELEQVMMDFIKGTYDILVATTIIESGLDIPSANTILINRADHFGLAQLYQLRGRVGRSHRRAFAYFLAPGQAGLTDIARKRLKAIEELSELGSGFKLAARDMEIRGAGNILGPEQSGHIDAVGFETYCEMLEDAIKELKGEPVEERFDVAMNISLAGRIPSGYIPSLADRMDLYNRFYAVTSMEGLADLDAELNDRFGPIPEDVEKLLAASSIRILCGRLKIIKLDIVREKLYMIFDQSTKIRPDEIVAAARKTGRKLRFTSENGAEYALEGADWRERLRSISDFMELTLGRAGD